MAEAHKSMKAGKRLIVEKLVKPSTQYKTGADGNQWKSLEKVVINEKVGKSLEIGRNEEPKVSLKVVEEPGMRKFGKNLRQKLEMNVNH